MTAPSADRSNEPTRPGPNGTRLAFRFLTGERSAVRALAAGVLPLRTLFALTVFAAVFREYDGEYLAAEPWHQLRPAAASDPAESGGSG